MSEQKPQTLWGLPVVVSDSVPKGEIVMGRFPSAEEILEHGSVEKAIEAQKKQWARIKGLPTE